MFSSLRRAHFWLIWDFKSVSVGICVFFRVHLRHSVLTEWQALRWSAGKSCLGWLLRCLPRRRCPAFSTGFDLRYVHCGCFFPLGIAFVNVPCTLGCLSRCCRCLVQIRLGFGASSVGVALKALSFSRCGFSKSDLQVPYGSWFLRLWPLHASLLLGLLA